MLKQIPIFNFFIHNPDIMIIYKYQISRASDYGRHVAPENCLSYFYFISFYFYLYHSFFCFFIKETLFSWKKFFLRFLRQHIRNGYAEKSSEKRSPEKRPPRKKCSWKKVLAGKIVLEKAFSVKGMTGKFIAGSRNFLLFLSIDPTRQPHTRQKILTLTPRSHIWVILLQTVRISKKKIRQYFKSHQNFFFASSSKMNRHVYQDFVEIFFSPYIIIENFVSYMYFARFYHV